MDPGEAEYFGWKGTVERNPGYFINPAEMELHGCPEKFWARLRKDLPVIDEGFKRASVNRLDGVFDSIMDKRMRAEHFVDIHPVYYDNARNWWLWNLKEFKWERIDKTDLLNAVHKQAKVNLVSTKEKTEMIEALRQVARLTAPKPVPPTWIQFKQIIVDIKTGEQFKASAEYFVTNPIPHELDPDGFRETPMMDKIFAEWVGEEEVPKLYEILAYCLLPDYPLHRIFCFIGDGLNGKSCFLTLLKRFVGGGNCCSTELDNLLTSRFEVTRLHKKLVCMMGETNFNEMSKTSMLKKLSGGDLIGFEYKNKDHFESNNYAKLLIATNNLPATTDKTEGFYRRWMITDFPNKFSEKFDVLATIPEEEYGALALKCTYILNDLLTKREFTNEGSIKERMKTYEDYSNPLDKFLREEIIENHDSYIWKFEFSDRLKEWCQANRFRELGDVYLGKRMKQLGFTQSLKSAGDFAIGKKWRAWTGLKWKDKSGDSDAD